MIVMTRIFIRVPAVEDLHTVVEYLSAAGAKITTRSREFVVEAPLTPNQALAAWRLSRFRDGHGESAARLDVRGIALDATFSTVFASA